MLVERVAAAPQLWVETGRASQPLGIALPVVDADLLLGSIPRVGLYGIVSQVLLARRHK